MSFVVLPFITLSFTGSVGVWAHVYFYGIVGVFSSLAFFASPAKAILVKKLKKRNTPYIPRTASQENIRAPALGLPNDPGRDIDEAVQEIRAEIESRRRRGSTVTMPTGEELKAAIEEKLGRKFPPWNSNHS